MRKQIVGLVGAAAVTAGVFASAPAAGATTDGTAWSTFAPVASTPNVSAQASKVGGPITRKEVISRAKYWYDHRSKIKYNWQGSYRDPQGRRYRTDCSGYVSMALHLKSSLSTVTLPGVGKKIARKSMQAGDFTGRLGAGTGGAAGHVRIFVKWVNKSAGTYKAYDFGSTPVKYQTYKLSTDKRAGHWFVSYRYKKIK
jgi:hypothetical protein